MGKFIVMKGSRCPEGDVVSVRDAYDGPTCERAWTRPGHVYASRRSAQRAATAMGEMNPVGFDVYEVGSRWKKGE